MAITLFVDSLNEDRTIGMAVNREMMLLNARSLHVTWNPDDDPSSTIFAAGRYVCVIGIFSDKVGMSFMDFKKNKENALAVSRYYKSSEMQKLFMQVFEKVSDNYVEWYDDVELKLDTSFVPDIVVN